MDKVFKLRVEVDNIGRYNAHKITTIYVVCKTSVEALNAVYERDLCSVEIVDVQPCLIVK